MSDQLSFHNPYHFVPVEKPENRDHWLGVEKEFRSRQLNHYGHDCYHPYTYSGRIVCCLTTESPVVIGGEREKPTNDNEPATVKPFELTPGQPAIPASSLRGLLSSIAEAASNSALRVLDDKVLSYRKAMTESLSALGMVFVDKRDEKGNPIAYCLKPLALPTLKKDNRDSYTYNTHDNKEKRAYAQMFRKFARLKVYVGDYQKDPASGFLENKETFSITKPEFYYAHLHNHRSAIVGDSFVLYHDDFLHVKHVNRNSYLIGQKITGSILTHEEWQSKPNSTDYTRGILRVLGKKDRNLPNTKKHELFIPYPKEADKWPDFPILPEAIERFKQLADERTEAEKNPPFLPYEPLGTERNEDHENLGEKLRLKEGDIVYFRPTLKDGKAVVAEIAFSSIWRGRVEAQGEPATVHKFFGQIDSELLPFHQGRNCISPAELLFGFVQKDDKDKKSSDKDDKDKKSSDKDDKDKKSSDKDDKDKKSSDAGLALAGRVQVSFGQLAQPHSPPYYKKEVLLKSLLSPKLPSPAMYFFKPSPHSNSDDYITKSELSPLKHRPQGRKMYLHHPDNEKTEESQKTQTTCNDKVRCPWESRDAENKKTRKLKSFATPIRKNLHFYFHLDFNNLDEWELGLLFYALRPYEEFRHKLGMGKAIGLGTVQIDPVGLFLIDRDQRYRVDDIFQAPRYHQVWVAGDATKEKEKWPESYGREKQADGKTPDLDWKTLRDERFKVTMTGAIQKALELLGDPAKVAAVVHTPQIFSRDKEGHSFPKVTDPEMERESFKWFVANEKGPRDMLTPLTEKSDKLPTLKRIEG